MSEQLSIDSQQIVAQAAPQTLKSGSVSQPAGAEEFKNILSKQQVGGNSNPAGDAPAAPQPPLAVNAARALPVLTGLTAGGNVLPDAGNVLKLVTAEATGKSPAKTNIISDLLPEAGSAASDVLEAVESDDANIKPITAEAPQQAVIDNSRTTLLVNALTSQAATGVVIAPPAEDTDVVANTVSTAVSTVVAGVASSTAPATAAYASTTLGPNANSALQDLVSAQQESSQALDKRIEAGQFQFSPSPSSSQAQPQSSIVAYHAVAQTTGATLPAGTASLPAQPLPTLDINVPLQSPDWGRAFSERAVWMVNNQQSAQVRITPASLGQIDIQIKIKDDDASIIIHTQNGLVKETVESSIPRLREMLESQGLNLLDVNVSERHDSKQNDFTSAFADYNESGDTEDHLEPLMIPLQQRSWISAERVDTYA